MKNTYEKKGRVALYNPYLDVLGGGERHILSILQVFDKRGYFIEIFWDHNLKKRIKERFGISFQNLSFKSNIFKQRTNPVKKAILLSKYSHFFYIPDGSYFFSLARHNYIFAMVPNLNLYPHTLKDRIKTFNFELITNSPFTKEILKSQGYDSKVILPYIKAEFSLRSEKKNYILSVGRFFPHLHNKRQDVIIKTFIEIKQRKLLPNNYNLILAGGVKKEDLSYLTYLKKISKNRADIKFVTNPSFPTLLSLYKEAQFYFHFAGFGVDETKHPEQVEHLGITPLEAMAAGCVVFAYKAGGVKYTIDDGKNGFLFKNKGELFHKLETVIKQKTIMNNIRERAQEEYKKYSWENFEKRVRKTLKI